MSPHLRPLRRAGPALALALALAGCGGGDDDRADREPLQAGAPTIRTTDVGGTPGAVAVAGDAVWVADGSRGRLTQVDPRTGAVEGSPIPVPAVLALAADEAGVWSASGTGAVGRLDPSARRVRTVARVADPGGIAVGQGSVWVTSRRDGTVAAFDPRTGRPRGRAIRTGAVPADVVAGPDGVWVANTQDGTVSRVDPRTLKTVGEPVKVADAQILAMTAGPGGVWVAATDSAQNAEVELRRIDPKTGDLDADAVALPTGVPIELAAGLGSVWSTDVGNVVPGTPAREAAVRRVDARAGVPVDPPIPVGEQPGGVAVGAGAVWVTSAGEGTLRRITPGAVRR